MKIELFSAAVLAFASSAASGQHSPDSGQLRAWGFNQFGQTNVPGDLGPILDAAGGFVHTLALDGNGYVHAWGAGTTSPPTNVEPDFGQSVVPADLGTAIRVGAGYYHSIAQKPDGTLRLWGRNNSGQCNVPQDLVVTDFAAGGNHTVVLLPNGTVRCFGAGFVSPPPNTTPEYGQSLVPAVVADAIHPDFVPVVQVTAGFYFTAVLRQDGSIIAWGDNLFGQCTPPADLGAATKISAGRSHCIALLANGSIRVWGGLTNDGDNVRLAQVPPELKFAVDIAAGFRCNIGIDEDGKVYVWGSVAATQAYKRLVPSDLGSADRVWGIGRHLLARTGPPPAPPDCNGDGFADYLQCRDGSLPDYNLNNVPDCCEAGVPCEVGRYPVQWRAVDGGNGHWYRLAIGSEPGIDWSTARDQAVAHGGHLATSTSLAENQFLLSISSDLNAWHVVTQWPGYCSGPWLGGFQPKGSVEPGSGWTWVTGEPWSWQNWWTVEPNDGCNGEDFLHFLTQGATTPSGWWNDGGGDCPPLPKSYLIEWSADCNNDGIVDYGQILRGQLADTNSNGVPDTCEPCPGDVNNSDAVNGVDLAIVLGAWGTSGQADGDADINNDGIVNGQDLAFVLGAWGPCP